MRYIRLILLFVFLAVVIYPTKETFNNSESYYKKRLTDTKGNVYVADVEVYIYDSKRNQTGVIHIPERPSSLAFGGKDKKTLSITRRSGLYSLNIK